MDIIRYDLVVYSKKKKTGISSQSWISGAFLYVAQHNNFLNINDTNLIFMGFVAPK